MRFRSVPQLHVDNDFSDVDAPGWLPEGQQNRSARASREDFWDHSEKNLLIAKLAEARKNRYAQLDRQDERKWQMD